MADDIEMEHFNAAQQQTTLAARDRGYVGDFVFAVGVDGSNPPATAVSGFSAVGWREGAGVMGLGGVSGVGVSGQGGGNGTGVVGKGGDHGGKGVQASGGEALPKGEPGTGVEATGGLSDRSKGPDDAPDNRNPNAPGIVATSGGSSQSTTLAETGNVGVFGQGGDWVDETKNDTPKGERRRPDFTVGPDFAGAGVIGRGGVRMKNSEANGAVVRATDGAGAPEPGSAGIVGIAGGLTIPEPKLYSDTGVFGQSGTGDGVSGLSTNGIGVNGVSTTNAGVSGVNRSTSRIAAATPLGVNAAGVLGFASDNPGGLFMSLNVAQLRLFPLLPGNPPTIAGLAGDLLATIDAENSARLWFCTKDGTQNWVLIGGP
jgi:hypothetical protein